MTKSNLKTSNPKRKSLLSIQLETKISEIANNDALFNFLLFQTCGYFENIVSNTLFA